MATGRDRVGDANRIRTCGLAIATLQYVALRETDEPLARSISREPPELHALACFVHGALTALHVLGAVYNCRRRNWWDVMAHLAAAAYGARSVRHHHRVEQIARLRQSSRRRPDSGDERLATPA